MIVEIRGYSKDEHVGADDFTRRVGECKEGHPDV